MKLPVMAAAGLAVGIVGGALTSGLGVKAEILEARVQAEADSLAALEQAAGAQGHEGVTVDLPVEEHDTTAEAGAVDLPPDETPVDPEHAVAPPEEGQPQAPEGRGIQEATGVANPASLPLAGPDSAGAPPTQGGAVDGAGSPAGSPPAGPVSDEGSRKLAKIFAAMDPDDAAAVLREMTDEEVTAILVRMSDRLAAPVIAAFPPERAATLTQAVLRASPGGA